MPEDTLLVYHTLHVPHQTSDPGMWENDPYLPQHVKQLNAAGRHVAQALHFHIVDLEAMAAQVSKATLLVDNTHPGPDFMMQAGSRPALLLSASAVSFQASCCRQAAVLPSFSLLPQSPPRLHAAGRQLSSPSPLCFRSLLSDLCIVWHILMR